MASVILFHHAQGLTDGVGRFADRLRDAGHAVLTPDLFQGATFQSLDEGVQYVEQIGFDAIIERGCSTASDLPERVVYAGFSLGVLPAQKLAQTRPGSTGAVLIHSCVPASEFGTPWPSDVPVQVHAMEADPFFVEDGDLEAARHLVETAGAELFLYPGSEHLFADDSLASYDRAAADLLLQRVLAFLARVDSGA